MKTVHLKISGKVQGVFFRATAGEIAAKYNIKGWIKNTKDDNVEAMITGKEEDVNKFIEWCKEGPEKAIVDDVIITQNELKNFDVFKVIR